MNTEATPPTSGEMSFAQGQDNCYVLRASSRSRTGIDPAGSTSNMPPHDPFNEGRCHMAKRFPLSSDHAIMLIPMTAGSALSPLAVFLAAHGDVLNQSIYARAWPVDAAA